MGVSVDELARWAGAQCRAHSGETPAQVRIRLSPSPLEADTVARVPWSTADRTADALEDALGAALAGVALADRVKARLEPLDGAGGPVRGTCRSRTWSPPPPTDPEPSAMPPRPSQPSPSAVVDAPGPIDVDYTEIGNVVELARTLPPPAEGAPDLRMAQAMQLSAMAALHGTARLLADHAERQEQRHTDLVQRLGGQVVDIAGELRRASQSREEAATELVPCLIDLTREVGEARGEAAVSKVEGALALAQAGNPPDKVDQTLQIVRELRGTVTAIGVERRLSAAAKAAAAATAGAAPAAPAASTTAPDAGGGPAPAATPPAAPEAAPAPAAGPDVGAILNQVLSGALPGDVVALAAWDQLSAEQRERLIPLAATLVQLGAAGKAAA